MFDKITWLGHSGILIESGKNIYFDPYNLVDGLPKADVIFITHPHYDHCSQDDIAKISTPDTLIVATPDSLAKLPGRRSVLMAPGDSKVCAGLEVKAKAAYNIKKPYHPKSKRWVGFLVDLGGFRVYHAGDTDELPEMAGLEPDIAFLPVDDLYNFEPHAGSAAAHSMRAKRALPLHFGTVCGSRGDAAKFLAECQSKYGLPGEFYKKERAGSSHQSIPAVAPMVSAA